MGNRKQILIDKQFQLKTTLKILGMIYLVFTAIIVAVGINAFYNNHRLEEIVSSHKDLISVQYEAFSELIVVSKEKNLDRLNKAKAAFSQNIDKNMNTVYENVATIKGITGSNNILFIIIIVFALSQGLVLYFVILRKTHSMAGPITLLTQYVKDISEGHYPEIRPLRKNDEFQELYNSFTVMVQRLKEREGRG